MSTVLFFGLKNRNAGLYLATSIHVSHFRNVWKRADSFFRSEGKPRGRQQQRASKSKRNCETSGNLF